MWSCLVFCDCLLYLFIPFLTVFDLVNHSWPFWPCVALCSLVWPCVSLCGLLWPFEDLLELISPCVASLRLV